MGSAMRGSYLQVFGYNKQRQLTGKIFTIIRFDGGRASICLWHVNTQTELRWRYPPVSCRPNSLFGSILLPLPSFPDPHQLSNAVRRLSQIRQYTPRVER
jgi:hypothetical protein